MHGYRHKKRNDFILFIGVVYPIVSHWAWAEIGWLYAGISYTDNGEEVMVHYQVRMDIS